MLDQSVDQLAAIHAADAAIHAAACFTSIHAAIHVLDWKISAIDPNEEA